MTLQINVREYRKGNQELTYQRHWQVGHTRNKTQTNKEEKKPKTHTYTQKPQQKPQPMSLTNEIRNVYLKISERKLSKGPKQSQERSNEITIASKPRMLSFQHCIQCHNHRDRIVDVEEISIASI
jgi:hypothetical protein